MYEPLFYLFPYFANIDPFIFVVNKSLDFFSNMFNTKAIKVWRTNTIGMQSYPVCSS